MSCLTDLKNPASRCSALGHFECACKISRKIKILLGAKSVNPICPIDNACNALAENVKHLYYDRT